jgi:kynureninase
MLHEWNVDAAAWCSYKYLNSGPGAAAGIFIHEDNFDAFRLGGWWGHEPSSRFDMPHEFKPQRGAAGWQWSNAPVFSMAPVYASLDIFREVDDAARQRKAEKLFDFLTTSLENAEIPGLSFQTPMEPGKHGAQLSIAVEGNSEELEQLLLERGVVCDHRPPNILRVAPVPLYNSFEDVARFVTVLSELTRSQ